MVLHEHEPLPTVDEVARAVVLLADRPGFERISFCWLSLDATVGMTPAIEEPARIDKLEPLRG